MGEIPGQQHHQDINTVIVRESGQLQLLDDPRRAGVPDLLE
jgi:hypothetical protein